MALNRCGHVSIVDGQAVRCEKTTSKGRQLHNGLRVYLCTAHAPKSQK